MGCQEVPRGAMRGAKVPGAGCQEVPRCQCGARRCQWQGRTLQVELVHVHVLVYLDQFGNGLQQGGNDWLDPVYPVLISNEGPHTPRDAAA
jgi:hypothetical protein